MDKHCEKCAKENVGCKEKQHLFRDVDKLKINKTLNSFLYFFITVVCISFVIISFALWKNMLAQPIATANISANELKQISELFNSQFSSLLTVLAILLSVFGVLLPIVNTIYQKQTLKDERESLRREINISLANLEAQEKKLEDKIESAKEERKKQIAEVRSELAQAIGSSRKSFSEKQETVKIKLEESQKHQTYSNGYFCQQLAFTNRNFLSVYCAYCSYAIMYYSVYAENNDGFAQSFSFIVGELKEKLQENNGNESFNSKTFIKNLKEAQENVRKDSIYWHKLQELIDIIEK